MVNTTSGTKQWVFQRVSNVIIVIVSIAMAVVLLTSQLNAYDAFVSLFASMWFKLTATLTVLVFAFNSMLAGWQIAGDYIKSPVVNKLFNFGCVAISALTVLIALFTLWG